MKISILGSGSFGTAMAVHLSSNATSVSIWSRNNAIIDEINTHKTNKKYLKNF